MADNNEDDTTQDDSNNAQPGDGSTQMSVDPSIVTQLYEAGHIDKDTLDRFGLNLSQTDPDTDDTSSDPVVDAAAKTAADKGVGPDQLASYIAPYITKAESGGNPDAVSNKGAQGLMQVEPATAAKEAKKLGMDSYDLKNPEDNTKIGTGYYKELLDKYNGNVPVATAAYNAGPGTVDHIIKKVGSSDYSAIKSHLPTETQNYVKKIDASISSEKGFGLKDVAQNIQSQQTQPQSPPPPAPSEQPGIISQIGNAVSTEMGGVAQAEEPAATPLPQTSAGPAPAAPVNTSPQGTSGATSSWDDNSQVPASQQTPAPIAQPNMPSQASQVMSVDPNLPDPSQQPQVQNPASQQPPLSYAQAAQQGMDANTAIGADKSAAFQQQSALQGQSGQDQQAQIDQQKAYNDQVQANMNDMIQKRDQVLADQAAAVKTGPDASRIFKNPSTWNVIQMGIGVMMSAVSGNPMFALGIINGAINKDLTLQQQEVSNREGVIKGYDNALDKYSNEWKDHNLAALNLRNSMLARTAALIQQTADASNSDIAKQTATAANSQIQMDIAKNNQEMLPYMTKVASMQALAMGGGQGTAAPANSANAGVQKSAQDAHLQAQSKANTIQLIGSGIQDKTGKTSSLIVNDPNTGMPVGLLQGGDPADRQRVEAVLGAHARINSDLANLRKISDKFKMSGQPVDQDGAQEAANYVASIHQALDQIQASGGTKEGPDISKAINNILPLDTFGQDSWWLTRAAKRDVTDTAEMAGFKANSLPRKLEGVQDLIDQEFVSTVNTHMDPYLLDPALKGQMLSIKANLGRGTSFKEAP